MKRYTNCGISIHTYNGPNGISIYIVICHQIYNIHYGILIEWLFSNKKEHTTETCYNMENLKSIMLTERSQTQKAKYCIIPFMQNSRIGQTNLQWQKARSKMIRSRVGSESETDGKAFRGNFLLDENGVRPNCSGSFTYMVTPWAQSLGKYILCSPCL